MHVNVELKKCEKEKNEIESILQTKNRVLDGAFDFTYYHLRKKQKEIREKIRDLRASLDPDIIA
jgi:hypothetical protein